MILTALPEEFVAVRGHLADVREETHAMGTVYNRGILGRESDWDILLVEVGPGNDGAAMEAERAISYFAPEVAVFVGIAGGIKDVSIGDVVVATKVYGYESGKDGVSGFEARPDVGQSSYALVQRARAVSRLAGLIRGKVRVGPIAAGQKVLAFTQSATAQFLRSHYGDVLAVEMEGRGFLTAAHANQSVQALVVRGISDLLDGKLEADKRGSQEVAASNAAVVSLTVLSEFGATAAKSEPAVGVARTASTSDPVLLPPKPGQPLRVAMEAASTLAACELDWDAQRRSRTASLNLAKGVISRARAVIAPLHTALKDRGVQQGLLNVLELALDDAVRLEQQGPTNMIGFSQDAFWATGSEVIRRIQQVLAAEEVRKLKE